MDFKRLYLNSSGNYTDGEICAQRQQPLVIFLVSFPTVRIVSFDSSTGCACDHVDSCPDRWFEGGDAAL